MAKGSHSHHTHSRYEVTLPAPPLPSTPSPLPTLWPLYLTALEVSPKLLETAARFYPPVIQPAVSIQNQTQTSSINNFRLNHQTLPLSIPDTSIINTRHSHYQYQTVPLSIPDTSIINTRQSHYQYQTLPLSIPDTPIINTRHFHYQYQTLPLSIPDTSITTTDNIIYFVNVVVIVSIIISHQHL